MRILNAFSYAPKLFQEYKIQNSFDCQDFVDANLELSNGVQGKKLAIACATNRALERVVLPRIEILNRQMALVSQSELR